MEWSDVRDVLVLRDEWVRHMLQGDYSGVGRRRYKHTDTWGRKGDIFLSRILYCVDQSVGRKQGRKEGRKEGSKEMWVQLLVYRYCCPCIMNLTSCLYKYFIIYWRRNEWQKWNSEALRRGGKGHFTEIVIVFWKCGRRQETKIETQFLTDGTRHGTETETEFSKDGTGQGTEIDTVFLTGAPQTKQ
jgi:hypothetical protein